MHVAWLCPIPETHDTKNQRWRCPFFHARDFYAPTLTCPTESKQSAVFTFRSLDNPPVSGTKLAFWPELLLSYVSSGTVLLATLRTGKLRVVVQYRIIVPFCRGFEFARLFGRKPFQICNACLGLMPVFPRDVAVHEPCK